MNLLVKHKEDIINKKIVLLQYKIHEYTSDGFIISFTNEIHIVTWKMFYEYIGQQRFNR